jgi:hypothetical protein
MHRFQNGNPSPEIGVHRTDATLGACPMTHPNGRQMAPHCETHVIRYVGMYVKWSPQREQWIT